MLEDLEVLPALVTILVAAVILHAPSLPRYSIFSLLDDLWLSALLVLCWNFERIEVLAFLIADHAELVHDPFVFLVEIVDASLLLVDHIH